MFVLKRFEFKEQWLDHNWLNADHKEIESDAGQQKVKPPTARTAPDDRVENPNDDGAEDERHDFRLCPIPTPRAPALDRLLVLPRQRLAIDFRRQAEHTHSEQKQRRENPGLDKSAMRNALGQVAIFRRHAQIE